MTLAEARETIDAGWYGYNRVRPHSARADSDPEEFAAAWQAAVA